MLRWLARRLAEAARPAGPPGRCPATRVDGGFTLVCWRPVHGSDGAHDDPFYGKWGLLSPDQREAARVVWRARQVAQVLMEHRHQLGVYSPLGGWDDLPLEARRGVVARVQAMAEEGLIRL